jgi:hypothetical protein
MTDQIQSPQPALLCAIQQAINTWDTTTLKTNGDGMLSEAMEVLRAEFGIATADQPAMLIADPTAEQAEAWMSVCAVLHDVRPGWHANGDTGMAAAIATIRHLAQPQPKADELEHADD